MGEATRNIVPASDADRRDWNDYVAARRARAFARFEWGAALAESYGAKPFNFLAKDPSGAVSGVLAGYGVRDARGRRRFFGVRNGLVTDDPSVASALLEAALAAARSAGASSALLGSGAILLPLEGLVVRKSLALELGGDEEATWNKLRRETRVGVKRSVKRDARVEWGYHNLAAFHEVFVANMLDKGVSVHSLRFLQKLREHLGKDAELIVVLSGDRVVAGMIVLWSADRLDLYLGAWLREYAAVVPYQRMYWEAIREAQRRGVRIVDMGESAEGSGTFTFKRNFGCTASEVHYYAWPPRMPKAEAAEASSPARWRAALQDAARRLPTPLRQRIAEWRQAHGRLV